MLLPGGHRSRYTEKWKCDENANSTRGKRQPGWATVGRMADGDNGSRASPPGQQMALAPGTYRSQKKSDTICHATVGRMKRLDGPKGALNQQQGWWPPMTPRPRAWPRGLALGPDGSFVQRFHLCLKCCPMVLAAMLCNGEGSGATGGRHTGRQLEIVPSEKSGRWAEGPSAPDWE